MRGDVMLDDRSVVWVDGSTPRNAERACWRLASLQRRPIELPDALKIQLGSGKLNSALGVLNPALESSILRGEYSTRSSGNSILHQEVRFCTGKLNSAFWKLNCTSGSSILHGERLFLLFGSSPEDNMEDPKPYKIQRTITQHHPAASTAARRSRRTPVLAMRGMVT